MVKIIICNKQKKDLFVALFQILKNCTSVVRLNFEKEKLYIQGMDKAHICLFNLNIQKKWFDEYIVDEPTVVSFDTSIFYLVISTKQDSHNINIFFDGEDSISIDLIAQENAKGDFDKHFKIPLVDYDYEEMNIPSVEYDADFSITSKKICEITSQMMSFGTDINFKCSEEKIDIIANGIMGEMLVNIPIEDLIEYSIVEGGIIDLKYSLSYIHKMCLTNKLSSDIQFSISDDRPIKIMYDLGDDSSLVFFMAPKMNED
jgi:proliferating cell nuclear antigen PCNA